MIVRNQFLADETHLQIWVSLKRFNQLSKQTIHELDDINIHLGIKGGA
jgi:hypothetical protein